MLVCSCASFIIVFGLDIYFHSCLILPSTCLLVQSERKGSCDSLTSQRSSDSQSSTTVRETLHVARKQIQALIGQYLCYCLFLYDFPCL